MLPSFIGKYSLIFGFLISFPIFYYSIIDYKKLGKLNTKIISFSFLQLVLVIISFACLIISFVISDFSNETVFNNSHTTKPLFYKIAGTWGNHEGSLLLWLLVLTLFVFIFLLTSKKQPKSYRVLTILFQQIIIFGFFLFVIITSNPFVDLFPIPKEGLGLNPILQDPALAIHPPVLYLGYVGTSIIFSSALSATVLNYISSSWATHIKKWTYVSWIFLTIGILLGSIWAYYELGWGGFWFWDPVENVSLMPWLALITLIHCLLVLEKRSLLKSWVIILSITTFILSMSGTFLVRSGILNSVHTFANDPERGVFILLFLFSLVLFSLVVFFFFNKNEDRISDKFFWLSKDTSILINNWFMMYFLSVVLIGTLYPIFLDVITSEKISVGPPFYHKLIAPFLLFFIIVMAIAPKLSWIKSKFVEKFSLIFFLIISLLLSSYIIYRLNYNFLINSLLLSAAFFLFFVTLKDFFINKTKNMSQKISHFGFGLFILSILLNNFFSAEIITNLKVGETYDNGKIKIYLEKVERFKKQNYDSVIGYFDIIDNKNKIQKFEPELRIYNQPIMITSEADIKTNLFYDKFLVINVVQNQNYFNLRYQHKPLMSWIWISVIIISFGGIMNLFYLRNEN